MATCKAHDVTPRLYLNSVIEDMPYKEKASQEELLQMLPHKWKLSHPEAVITKENNSNGATELQQQLQSNQVAAAVAISS